MAYKRLTTDPIWYGLSSDTLPTLSKADVDSEAVEMDTGDRFQWDGNSWNQTHAAGIPLKRATSSTAFIASTVLASGTATHSLAGAPLPATVWVNPRAGDTVSVSVRYESGGDLEAWTPGAVTVVTSYLLDASAFEIVFQRTAGTGTTSTYGVNI